VEEYVPEMVPTSSASTYHFIESPPRKNKVKSIKIIVIELLKDRDRVSVTALFTKSTNEIPFVVFIDSRTLS